MHKSLEVMTRPERALAPPTILAAVGATAVGLAGLLRCEGVLKPAGYNPGGAYEQQGKNFIRTSSLDSNLVWRCRMFIGSLDSHGLFNSVT